MPKVSVIIPTHSRPHLLPRAVESAQQAGTDVEVIVVDDASTDETAAICRKLEGIKYVRIERNQRVAGARNIGILASSAEYLAFLDDDDVRLPGTLDWQVAALEGAPAAGFVYGQSLTMDQNGLQLSRPPGPAHCPEGDLFEALLAQCFFLPLTVVFRKAALLRVGLLDKTLPGIDDWDLWVRIAELYPAIAIAQPVAVWREATPTSEQGTSNLSEIYLRAAQAYPRWLALPRLATASAQKRKELLDNFLARTSDMLIWTASHALAQGHIAYSRKNLLAALRLAPRRALRPWTLKLLGACYLSRWSQKGAGKVVAASSNG